METHGMTLLAVCSTAFVVVFGVLGLLAVVMHLITLLFPERQGGVEPALIAAIAGAVSSAHPGLGVAKIEEE